MCVDDNTILNCSGNAGEMSCRLWEHMSTNKHLYVEPEEDKHSTVPSIEDTLPQVCNIFASSTVGLYHAI